jgi:hypothetical protein
MKAWGGAGLHFVSRESNVIASRFSCRKAQFHCILGPISNPKSLIPKLRIRREEGQMNTVSLIRILSLLILVPFAVMAQVPRADDVPLKNWSAPAYWQPTEPRDAHEATLMRQASLNPQVTFPSQPLVFVAMAPCRLIDTRAAAGFPSPFGPPSLIQNATRTFSIPASTNCTVPTSAQAYSLNVTVAPLPTPSAIPGQLPSLYLGALTIYPTGTPRPSASTLNNYQGTVVANAAIVAAGANGSIDVWVEDNTDLIIDINGYYVPSTASASQWTTSGSSIFYTFGNVGVGTSTPSQKLDVAGIGRFTGGIMFGDGTTQTTAASVGSGGSQWTTSGSNIYFNSGNVGIGTASPDTKLEVNGNLTVDNNIGIGGIVVQTKTGAALLQLGNDGLNNVAAGIGALSSLDGGFGNTAVGGGALHSNTTGSDNTAIGLESLATNTKGGNVAVGFTALEFSTGVNNTAVGSQTLSVLATGDGNIAIGNNAGVNISSGSSNIDIGNAGGALDTGIIRIGTQSTQLSAFIAAL